MREGLKTRETERNSGKLSNKELDFSNDNKNASVIFNWFIFVGNATSEMNRVSFFESRICYTKHI